MKPRIGWDEGFDEASRRAAASTLAVARRRGLVDVGAIDGDAQSAVAGHLDRRADLDHRVERDERGRAADDCQ